MTPPNDLVIFTDLDGTLLSHHDYSFFQALPILNKINRLGIPLILNSSKTLSELLEIRVSLNNHHPLVVENGTAIFIPKNYFSGYTQTLNQISLGAQRNHILQVLNRIRQSGGYSFVTFNDLSIEQLADKTGLSLGQAEKAKERTGTEPIEWLDSETKLNDFTRRIESEGLKLIKGGRFFHVMGQTDKAKAFDWLVNQYKTIKRSPITTIALGDSQNDKAMLERADIAVVVRPHQGNHMHLNKSGGEVIYTEHAAPQGWHDAMETLLNRIL